MMPPILFEPSEVELEEARNAEYILRITGLDYMRLGDYLRRSIALQEARAEALEALATKEPDKREAWMAVADATRREAEHFARIERGLSSAWKPGRAPR